MTTWGRRCPQKVVFWKSSTVRGSVISIAGGADDSCETQPQGVLVDPRIPCKIEDRKEDGKRRGVERGIGEDNEEPCIGCNEGRHEDDEKDNHRQLIGKGIAEGRRTENGEPQIDGSGVPPWEKEKSKDEQRDERRAAEEVPLKETGRQDGRGAKKGNLHKETCARHDQESNEGQEDDPTQTALTRGDIAWKLHMTDATRPVWIVPNVLIKTGSVNIERRPSTRTGGDERRCVALFEADATLHWC